MNEPPIPDPSPEPEEVLPVLTCPNCGHKLELTWGRYWRSPTGKHRCPACRQVSKVKLSIEMRLLTGVVGALGALPPVLWSFYTTGFGDFTFVIWGVSALIIILPLDRYLESRFGTLKKV